MRVLMHDQQKMFNMAILVTDEAKNMPKRMEKVTILVHDAPLPIKDRVCFYGSCAAGVACARNTAWARWVPGGQVDLTSVTTAQQ